MTEDDGNDKMPLRYIVIGSPCTVEAMTMTEELENTNGAETQEEPMSTTVEKSQGRRAKSKKKAASAKTKKAAAGKTTAAKNGAVKPAKKPTKSAAKSGYDFKEVQNAAILLKQASDPTRLQVLLMLGEGDKFVGELCSELDMSQPAVSHHLALLRHGGLITPRRNGKQNFYCLSEKGEQLSKVISAFV